MCLGVDFDLLEHMLCASLPALMQRYHISQEVALVGVTLFVFGFAAGPLVFGPASELYGRQALWLRLQPQWCIVADIPFSFGFFGSASMNNVPASIGDITTPLNRGTLSWLSEGLPWGPLISAFIEHDAGWQWNLRVMAIFNTVLSILVAFVPETHGPTLLKWRLERGREHSCAFDLQKDHNRVSSRPCSTCALPIHRVLYGILYGFFEGFTVVYLEIRHFQTTSYGLTYIALGLGFVAAYCLLATVGQQQYVKSAKTAADKGISTPPEARLTLTYFGAIISPISLFLFAWTAPFSARTLDRALYRRVPLLPEYDVDFHGICPVLGRLLSDDSSKCFGGAVLPVELWYHGLTVQGATSLLAGIACLLAPIPFVFSRYGSAIRANSRNIGGN
ncbi:major facilitator superfamily domain-containing protein [Favolaschia claudopus]|uniref:Major facilitator superfamily domain-containing protein n=1 Tax=Favolaschia claudopus TaxID=2862362 RepID=A0AAW0BSH8_9AGAR